jgi:hypothetical protein
LKKMAMELSWIEVAAPTWRNGCRSLVSTVLYRVNRVVIELDGLCYARQNTENYTYSEFVQVYYAAFLVTKSSRDVASSPSRMLPAAQHACWRLSDRKMPAVVCAQLPSISSKPSPIKAVTGVADSTRTATATATTESRDPRGGGWRRERATRPQGPGGTAAASTV